MKKFALCLVLAVLAAPTVQASEISDPFEGYNRVMFKFNDAVDQNVLVPIVKGYRYVVPEPARNGVHNALTNLQSPVTIGNQLLQGDLSGAGKATVRMIVNTLIGVGGLFDVAGSEGIEHEPEDFGQTLAVWGLGDGPYVVPPLFPPGSLRDLTGKAIDSYADPVRLWMSNTDREATLIARAGLDVIDTREQYLDVLADLRASAVDYYATVRSVNHQRRAALIRDDRADEAEAADIPNY